MLEEVKMKQKHFPFWCAMARKFSQIPYQLYKYLQMLWNSVNESCKVWKLNVCGMSWVSEVSMQIQEMCPCECDNHFYMLLNARCKTMISIQCIRTGIRNETLEEIFSIWFAISRADDSWWIPNLQKQFYVIHTEGKCSD